MTQNFFLGSFFFSDYFSNVIKCMLNHVIQKGEIKIKNLIVFIFVLLYSYLRFFLLCYLFKLWSIKTSPNRNFTILMNKFKILFLLLCLILLSNCAKLKKHLNTYKARCTQKLCKKLFGPDFIICGSNPEDRNCCDKVDCGYDNRGLQVCLPPNDQSLYPYCDVGDWN